MKKHLALLPLALLFVSCTLVNDTFLKGRQIENEYLGSFPGGFEGYSRNVILVTSLSEAEALIDREKNHENYDEQYDAGYCDFLSHFDFAYFERNSLLLVSFWEGSGSNRNEFMALMFSEGEIVIHIDRTEPDTGTCDMRRWSYSFSMNKTHDLHPARIQFHGDIPRVIY